MKRVSDDRKIKGKHIEVSKKWAKEHKDNVKQTKQSKKDVVDAEFFFDNIELFINEKIIFRTLPATDKP